jgi:basic membrane protein A
MNQFGYGYVAGVLDTNADCTVQQYNANSFADAAAGKSAATSMVTNGADVIFHAAGGTGLGVIEGCKESGIYAIGVDSDQSSLAPETILTSAMKRVDNACYDIAKECLEGNVTSGVITYDLASSGVDIAPTTDNLTDEMIAAVEDAKAKIISGEIAVPTTQADFEAKYGDVYELD